MTGPEQHAAALRDTIERAYKRGKALYPIPADAYDAERAAALAELDELVALAGRADELEAAGEAGLLVLLDASAVRLKAAEARADELQREREVLIEQITNGRRAEAGLRGEWVQARREADQLRAALRDYMNAKISRDYQWQRDSYSRLVALAGVQAEEPRT